MPTTVFSNKTTITGNLVTLRPVTLEDVPTFTALMADPEVAQLTGSVHSSDACPEVPWTSEQLNDAYGTWMTADDRIVWTVVENATGNPIGESVLFDLSPENRSCSFRIWLGSSRSKGLGTEATRLTVDHALGPCGLHRVELEVYAFNPRAIRAYEKCGFVHEGTKRDALMFDGSGVDCHVMSRLATDS